MRVYERTRQEFIGQRFGRLVIVGFDRKNAICNCDCGRKGHPARFSNVKRGLSSSCGCRLRELSKAGLLGFKHGHGVGSKSSPTHRAWCGMRRRCKKNDAAYHNYGGRGISVCERWQGRSGFANFLMDMKEKPGRATLERVNNDRGYGPDNCIWANAQTQARNRRSCRRVTAFGETKLIIEWFEDERCTVKEGTLRRRLWAGWIPEKAITEPPTQ